MGFSPLDEELGLLPGRLTPRLQEALVRLSTWIPSFAKAANEFMWFTQVQVDRTTAARITEAAGAAAVEMYVREVAQIEQAWPATAPGPDKLIYSVDGAMVPLQHRQWAEARTLAVGSVTTVKETTGELVNKTSDLSYFSKMIDSDTFNQQVLGELHRRGIDTAKQVGAVMDGALWCQTCIDLHSPEAVRILDFAHAAEYLTDIGQTQAEDGATVLSDADLTRLRHDLKHTGPAPVLAELRHRVAAHPGVPALESKLAYLEKRQAQMQYPQFVAQGWPIGSGCVESANKLVVEDRLKGAGMHWAAPNVNPLLALRNAVCNDRWSEVWGKIETERRQSTAARRAHQHQKRRSLRSPPPRVVAPEASLVQPAPVRPAHPAASTDSPEPRRPARPAANHPWRVPWSRRLLRQPSKTA